MGYITLSPAHIGLPPFCIRRLLKVCAVAPILHFRFSPWLSDTPAPYAPYSMLLVDHVPAYFACIHAAPRTNMGHALKSFFPDRLPHVYNFFEYSCILPPSKTKCIECQLTRLLIDHQLNKSLIEHQLNTTNHQRQLKESLIEHQL